MKARSGIAALALAATLALSACGGGEEGAAGDAATMDTATGMGGTDAGMGAPGTGMGMDTTGMGTPGTMGTGDTTGTMGTDTTGH